jgi:fumarate hydratase class II
MENDQKMRIEHDVLGEVKVPADALWMSQTQRSLENFPISTEKMPRVLIDSFAYLKMACAIANCDYHKITLEQKDAIVKVCRKILAGELYDAFPLSIWQTGSGTQTNMNLNEVISYLGNQEAGKNLLHPNDTVNASQSSNDTFPAALHIMVCLQLRNELFPSLEYTIETLKEIEEKFRGIIKIGRTHLQDATPLYLSDEISGYRSMLEHSLDHLKKAIPSVQELAIGATAVGSGLNAPKGFGQKVCALLDDMTGIHFKNDPNLFHALTSKDACVFVSGALKGLAANAFKIANDIRLLSSGPRCGIGELIIPANEPGSSIMPGKVNPTQCEALTMVCVQVMGNDAAIGFAASQGHFELNVFMPVIAYNLCQSITLLADALRSFTDRTLKGMEADENRIAANLHNSLMLVTCLNPVIGYENAGKAARYAYENNLTLKEAVLSLELLSEEQFDSLVDPKKMVEQK